MPEPLVGPGPIYTLDGVTPKVAPDAFIAPRCRGHRRRRDRLRDRHLVPLPGPGDMDIIRIGARTNIQDGAVVRIDSGGLDTYIGDDVTVGHNAVIHACTLKNRAFVGISATVLDGAVIEEGGMLGAGGLLTPGKVIGRERTVGRLARPAAPGDERRRAQKFDRNAVVYRDLARRFRAGLRST